MKKIALTLLTLFMLQPTLAMDSDNNGLPAQALPKEEDEAGKSTREHMELASARAALTHELSNTLSNFSGNMRYEKCRELLQAGADPDGKYHAVPFLLCAAFWNDVALAKILLEHGANIHVRGYKNATALKYAIEHQQGAPLCQVLLEYGVDINAKDSDGNTALEKSLSETYHYEVTKLLLDNGARVDDLLNFCKKTQISIHNYVAIIRHYRFYPLRTPQKLKESQERILCFLICLKREYPQLPRDLKRLILLSYLPDDTLNCPLPICKPFVRQMAPQIVAMLFGQDEAIKILKGHKYEQLVPILIEAGQRNIDDGYFHNVITAGPHRFDSQIEDTITRDMLNQENK